MPTSLSEIMLVIAIAGWMCTTAVNGVVRVKDHTTQKAKSAVHQLQQQFERLGEW